MSLLIMMSFFAVANSTFTWSVSHDHFIGEGQGTLALTEEGLHFEEEDDAEHSRDWRFEDIQQLKIEEAQKVKIRTYEDVGWMLNRDRRLELSLEEEIPLEAVRFLRAHLGSRLVSAIFAEAAEVDVRVPVKHLHRLWGGCHGVLVFASEALQFISETEKEHSRSWEYADLASVGRTSRRDLRVSAHEENVAGEFKNYTFKLKGALADEDFEKLWRRVHEPPNWLSQP